MSTSPLYWSQQQKTHERWKQHSYSHFSHSSAAQRIWRTYGSRWTVESGTEINLIYITEHCISVSRHGFMNSAEMLHLFDWLENLVSHLQKTNRAEQGIMNNLYNKYLNQMWAKWHGWHNKSLLLQIKGHQY